MRVVKSRMRTGVREGTEGGDEAGGRMVVGVGREGQGQGGQIGKVRKEGDNEQKGAGGHGGWFRLIVADGRREGLGVCWYGCRGGSVRSERQSDWACRQRRHAKCISVSQATDASRRWGLGLLRILIKKFCLR